MLFFLEEFFLLHHPFRPPLPSLLTGYVAEIALAFCFEETW